MNATSIRTRRQALGLLTTALGSGLFAVQTAAHGVDEGVQVKPIFKKELATHPEEEVSMTLVSYAPGTASKPHKHHGPVFVYVVEGAVELQIAGGPLTTVRAGETFYEPPGSIHTVSRNASTTEPAKLIAFIIGKVDTPVTSPVSE